MTQFVVGVVTVRLTVGFVLPVPELLDTLPFASTPEMVKL